MYALIIIVRPEIMQILTCYTKNLYNKNFMPTLLSLNYFFEISSYKDFDFFLLLNFFTFLISSRWYF